MLAVGKMTKGMVMENTIIGMAITFVVVYGKMAKSYMAANFTLREKNQDIFPRWSVLRMVI
jgi:hypothetical protein